MRNHKNNIILVSENIISFSKNITGHFTGKVKIITLISVIIMLSFANITLCSSNVFYNTNVSALSYSSNVGIGFTFNPTLSVDISPSNLVIDNLTPSITADSNAITVSVATNAAYGYTLSAIMNGNNSNLTHTNSISVFSSIATDASLSSLTDDNIWGYSYKNNMASSPTWSNYSGLSNEANKVLFNTDNNANGSIDFKIAAKAASTQASGTYTGVINFTAVSNIAPMSLLDSFIASGAEQLNGYYKMQDMTHDICSNVDIEESELQLIDVRDNKIYWVAKLKDGNCWMTQNLDFSIEKNIQNNIIALTSELTDLVDGSLSGIYASGYAYMPDPNRPDAPGEYNGLITWTPNNSTNKAYTLTTLNDWVNSSTEPYSYNKDNFYPDNTVTQEIANRHALSGNYYNWAAAVASNNANNAISSKFNNSICPKNWKLPTNNEYVSFYSQYNDKSGSNANGLFDQPLFFIRSGRINNKEINDISSYGSYISSVSHNAEVAYTLLVSNNRVVPNNVGTYKYYGGSVRCLAR